MHSHVFRIGFGALLLMVALMIAVELAAEVGQVDRAARAMHAALQLANVFLWVAVIAGCVLYPQAWRLYRERRSSMDQERRHLWIAILILGLPAAGYAAHLYLRRGS